MKFPMKFHRKYHNFIGKFIGKFIGSFMWSFLWNKDFIRNFLWSFIWKLHFQAFVDMCTLHPPRQPLSSLPAVKKCDKTSTLALILAFGHWTQRCGQKNSNFVIYHEFMVIIYTWVFSSISVLRSPGMLVSLAIRLFSLWVRVSELGWMGCCVLLANNT